MKKSILVITCSLSILLIACKSKKESSASADPSIPATQAVQDKVLLEVVRDPGYRWPGSTDQYEIGSGRIHGDTLFLEVSYGGGCKEHDFRMYTNMMWAKSLPPQLMIYLEHENNDDQCRAYITRILAFDISGLRYQQGQTAILILNGDRSHSFRYE